MPIKSQLVLFDKLILPILIYGFCNFGKLLKITWCKIQTQNNFICGEFGRTSLLTKWAVSVISIGYNWSMSLVKCVQLDNFKDVNYVHDLMCRLAEDKPYYVNSWAKSVKHLLQWRMVISRRWW